MYCYNCGKPLNKEFKYCPNCGSKQNIKIRKITKEEKGIKEDTKTKFMALLSYLFVLVLIPYFYVKDNEFVKFHTKEGIKLSVVWILYLVLYKLVTLIKVTRRVYFFDSTALRTYTPTWILVIINLVGLFILVINVIGIVNVLTNKKNKLPILDKIDIIK